MFFEKYLYYSLLLLILISKECLIFNEEILVLFSFVVFSRLVVTNISQFIVLELKTRIKKMKESYNFLKQLHNKSLLFYKEYTEKQARFSLFLIKSLILINNETLLITDIFQMTLNNKIISSGVVCLSSCTIISVDAIRQHLDMLRILVFAEAAVAASAQPKQVQAESVVVKKTKKLSARAINRANLKAGLGTTEELAKQAKFDAINLSYLAVKDQREVLVGKHRTFICKSVVHKLLSSKIIDLLIGEIDTVCVILERDLVLKTCNMVTKPTLNSLEALIVELLTLIEDTNKDLNFVGFDDPGAVGKDPWNSD
jgi:hypothetical protein